MITVPEQEPFSLNFQNAGYSTTLFLVNAKSSLFLYAIQLFLVFLFALLLYVMAKYCPNQLNKAKRYLLWNGTIRIFIANYLNICMFSLLNLKEAYISAEFQENEFKSVEASNWLSGIFLASCILVPIGVSIYYCFNSHRLNNRDFNNKVGTFIAGANRKSSLKALIVPQSFFLKSLVLCISLVFIQKISWAQLCYNFAI